MTDTIAGPLPPFVPELRWAIRDRNKTQTRRVIKEPGLDSFTPIQYGELGDMWGAYLKLPDTEVTRFVPCRYGRPGQIRYMREPLCKGTNDMAFYLDDGAPVRDAHGLFVPWRWKVNTLSSLFMPAEYARTFTKVARIHVERAQDISAQDAIAEGVSKSKLWTPKEMEVRPFEEQWWDDFYFWGHYPQIVFSRLWKQINDHRAPEYAWDSNPPVWVLGFNKLS